MQNNLYLYKVSTQKRKHLFNIYPINKLWKARVLYTLLSYFENDINKIKKRMKSTRIKKRNSSLF